MKLRIIGCVVGLLLMLTGCGGSGGGSGTVTDNSGTVTTASGQLNDTGINIYSDGVSSADLLIAPSGYPNQDAAYGRDYEPVALPKIGAGEVGFDFTKIAYDGQPFADQDLEFVWGHWYLHNEFWYAIRDNVTGLMWSVPVGYFNTRHYYNPPATPSLWEFWTFSWYNSDATTNGGHAGTELGGYGTNISGGGYYDDYLGSEYTDTEKYIAYQNRTALLGYSNWRLPTREELLGIMNFAGGYGNVLSSHFWPNQDHGAYWTSDTVAHDPLSAYVVYPGTVPVIESRLKSEANSVILVRKVGE